MCGRAGARKHDGVFDAVKFGTPFPLYGAGLPSDTWRTEVPDGSTQRIEDLFEHEEVCDDYCCDNLYEKRIQ